MKLATQRENELGRVKAQLLTGLQVVETIERRGEIRMPDLDSLRAVCGAIRSATTDLDRRFFNERQPLTVD